MNNIAVRVENMSKQYHIGQRQERYKTLRDTLAGALVAPIRIKRGCWIGQNVVIMLGINIGKMLIEGNNIAVTNSVPARCIAVGAPAKVIKTWDTKSRGWISRNS